MSGKQQVTPYPFRMEEDVRQGVDELAKAEDRSKNWLLNRLVRIAIPLWGAKQAKADGVGD